MRNGEFARIVTAIEAALRRLKSAREGEQQPQHWNGGHIHVSCRLPPGHRITLSFGTVITDGSDEQVRNLATHLTEEPEQQSFQHLDAYLGAGVITANKCICVAGYGSHKDLILALLIGIELHELTPEAAREIAAKHKNTLLRFLEDLAGE